MATREQNRHYREVAEKRAILRSAYGGLMTDTQLAKELGVGDLRTARQWAETVGLERILIGKRKKYDSDKVAKVLVDQLGMA